MAMAGLIVAALYRERPLSALYLTLRICSASALSPRWTPGLTADSRKSVACAASATDNPAASPTVPGKR